MIRAEQIVGQQQAIEDGEQPIVAGDLLVDLAAPDQGVDPLRGPALERVAAAIRA